MWPTLIPSLPFLFLLSCLDRNPPSHHLHPFVPFGSVFFLSPPFLSCLGGLRRSPRVARDSSGVPLFLRRD
uniref:Secreted protein n=1 Tax=Fagus sylvatica TaxID=28930 RepID=A0A2N9FEP5_FAGSY